MSLSDLQRKDVFQFVRDFAQLVEPACGRIALQRVDSAADTPDEFLIGRTFFELQPSIVDDLENLRGALKKECAELCAAILGQETQEPTSMRL
jgi:hypothetical protein